MLPVLQPVTASLHLFPGALFRICRHVVAAIVLSVRHNTMSLIILLILNYLLGNMEKYIKGTFYDDVGFLMKNKGLNIFLLLWSF